MAQLRKFTQTVTDKAWNWLNKKRVETGATSVPEVVRDLIAQHMDEDADP